MDHDCDAPMVMVEWRRSPVGNRSLECHICIEQRRKKKTRCKHMTQRWFVVEMRSSDTEVDRGN